MSIFTRAEWLTIFAASILSFGDKDLGTGIVFVFVVLWSWIEKSSEKK